MDKVWGLSKDISYNSRVSGAQWDDSKSRWDVTVTQMQLNGPVKIVRHSKSIIICTGFASAPYYPPFKGQDKFKGLMYHTSAWPQEDMSMKNKRVAVVGTGASGVQVIQTIAPQVKQLTVYQRTPNVCMPMRASLLQNEDTTSGPCSVSPRHSRHSWARDSSSAREVLSSLLTHSLIVLFVSTVCSTYGRQCTARRTSTVLQEELPRADRKDQHDICRILVRLPPWRVHEGHSGGAGCAVRGAVQQGRIALLARNISRYLEEQGS